MMKMPGFNSVNSDKKYSIANVSRLRLSRGRDWKSSKVPPATRVKK